jgi:hypothetical protein
VRPNRVRVNSPLGSNSYGERHRTSPSGLGWWSGEEGQADSVFVRPRTIGTNPADPREHRDLDGNTGKVQPDRHHATRFDNGFGDHPDSARAQINQRSADHGSMRGPLIASARYGDQWTGQGVSRLPPAVDQEIFDNELVTDVRELRKLPGRISPMAGRRSVSGSKPCRRYQCGC